MSRCPYCGRELPGSETLCQTCLEAGYDRIAHPMPWWQRMRFTQDCVYIFLFVFFYGYIILGINRNHHPTMVGLVLLALTLTAGLILIGVVSRDSRKPKVSRGRSLVAFVFLFLCFFLRLWSISSYHPFPNPALWVLVTATVAAIAESFRTESGRTSGSKK
jgi:hypothetical protein